MDNLLSRRRWLSGLVLSALLLAAAGCAAPPAASLPTPADPPATLPALPTVTPPPPTSPPTAEPTAEPTATPRPPTPSPAPTVAADPAIDAGLAERLDAILARLVRDGQIPGAVLSVHIPGRQPWSGASGWIDRARTQPMRPATEVRIASISKVFTAVVVLQLVEEGQLSLDEPLSTWFPDLVPNAEAITVERLLNHTSGLYDYLEDRGYMGQALAAPERRWAPAELVAYAARQPALFRPGAPGAWDYSSTNYVLLGMVVEAVTGATLAEEMRARIFEPLGLDQTYFAPDEPAAGVQARGYRLDADHTAVSMSFAYATANLVSTADDVRRFGEALFGGELLEPETMARMYTFEDGRGQYNMPALEYGLGLMRNQLPVGPAPASTVIGHTGGFAGFRSALWHAPESGVTVALAMNQAATDPNILATQVFDAILDAQGR